MVLGVRVAVGSARDSTVSPLALMVRWCLTLGVVFGVLVIALPQSAPSLMLTSAFDFTGGSYSNLERLALLLTSVQLFIENPSGYGLGSTSSLFANSFLTSGSYPHPHNALAMFIVELGVVGGALYLVLLMRLAAIAWRAFGQLSLRPMEATFALSMAAAVTAMTVYEAVFFNGSLAVNVFVAIGMALVASDILSDRQSSSGPVGTYPLG